MKFQIDLTLLVSMVLPFLAENSWAEKRPENLNWPNWPILMKF
jgi:hypothetical protein